MAASYAGCDRYLAVWFFSITSIGFGFMMGSIGINALDLSPNYSGAITAILNGIGSMSGFGAPSLIGLVTPNVGHSGAELLSNYSQIK